MKVYLTDPGNTVLDLDTAPYLAKGGEALIYRIPQLNQSLLGAPVQSIPHSGQVFKLFKKPDHPDYAGSQTDQETARERLIVHRQKLPELQKLQLPSNVVKPEYLGYESKNVRSLCGYSMRAVENAETLIQLFSGKYQGSIGVTKMQIMELLQALHATVAALHQQNVVIGDFNPLNVLFGTDIRKGIQHHMIDADSYQFGTFYCNTFTFGYVDPLVCDNDMLLVKPHTQMTDWYAFTAIMMHLLLYAGPYDGIHKPKTGKKLRGKQRVLKRITVFDPDVKYPKPAYDFNRLPDEVMQHFDRVFKHNHREIFPTNLLQMQWTTCTKCNAEHARPVCPVCTNPSPVAIVQKTTVKDGVVVSRIFQTEGVIVYATVEHGAVRYVYSEGGKLYRDNGKELFESGGAAMRYRIADNVTYVGRGHNYMDSMTQFRVLHNVDQAHGTSVFDVGGEHFYWVESGALYQRKRIPTTFVERQLKTRIAGGITDQTMIYMSNNIGLGWYMVGALPVAYVIHPKSKGVINFQMDAINGKLIKHTCHFGKDHIWFMLHYLKNGKETVRCILVHHNGTVVGTMEESLDPDSWFANILGMCAIGPYLFAPTDNGIVRVECRGGQISVTKEFEATEAFINQESQLLPGKGGIYVVDTHEITLLKM